MKQHACSVVVATLLFTVSMATFAKAPINGEDYANQASWSSEVFERNFGRLTIAGQRIGYTAANLPGQSPSNQDFAALAWAQYDPRPATEWTYQIDISLPDLSLAALQSVFFGLEANDQRNPNNRFSLGYNSSAGSTHEFTAVTPDGIVTRQCSIATPCGTATAIASLTRLRFRFDGTSNTLFTEFDPNLSDNDHAWIELSATDDFIPDTVYVFGQSSNRTVAPADNVYGTNVVTTAVLVPEPSTYVMLVLGVGLVSWLTRTGRTRIAS
jgi:hypothetical protein